MSEYFIPSFIFTQLAYYIRNNYFLANTLKYITNTLEEATHNNLYTTDQLYIFIKQRNHIDKIMKYNATKIREYSLILHNEYLKYYYENKLYLLDNLELQDTHIGSILSSS